MLCRLRRMVCGLFASPSPWLKPLRNCGMGLTERLPVAKNLLVRYALGAI